MTVRSSQFGGQPYKLGDMKPIPRFAKPLFFTEGGQEWLYSGTLRANTANAYSNLLAASPGLGVNFTLTADRTNSFTSPVASANSDFHVWTMYWNGTNYLLFPPGNRVGTNIEHRFNSSLAGAGTAVVLTTLAMTAHCQFTVGGITMFTTTDTTANQGIRHIVAGGSAVTNSTGSTAQAYGAIASNGSNLAVACAQAVASNAANGCQTSTNGTAWTPRTGSNGAIGATSGVIGVLWSPSQSKFFKWGGGATVTSIVILSSTDGFTDTTAKAEDATYDPRTVGTVNTGYQHAAASTPTADLIPVKRASDGMQGWLMSTNGTTWTFVSPFLDPLQRLQGVAATGMNLVYDAVRTRLVAWLTNGNSSGDYPAYYFSTDNGVTWTAAPGMDDEDTAVVHLLGFSNPNSQDLVHVGLRTAASFYRYSYAGTKMGAVASYVGLTTSYEPVANIRYAVRIK